MEQKESPAKKKNFAPFIIVPVVAILAFFGIRALLHSFAYEATDNAQIETNAVPIVSRLAGFIDTLNVKDYKDGAITQKQLEDSKNNFESTQKQLTANERQVSFAVSQVRTSEAQIRKAQAAVDTRKAALELSKLRLSYCKIYAPVTGKIGKR